MLSCFSCVRLCATPWTAAHQAPLSTELSRQELWRGLPFPSPDLLADLLNCRVGQQRKNDQEGIVPLFVMEGKNVRLMGHTWGKGLRTGL